MLAYWIAAPTIRLLVEAQREALSAPREARLVAMGARELRSLSRALERDRGVDETGGQVAVFGRIGSRPFNLEEQRKMYLKRDGTPWTVIDNPEPTQKKP